MDISIVLQFFQDVTGHKWLPLAILVVGYLTTIVSDTSKIPISIPDRFKPLLVIVLGQAYAVLQVISTGTPWLHAVWVGLMTSFGSMGLFDIVFKLIFPNGPPKWIAWISLIDPTLVQAKKDGVLEAPVLGAARRSIPPPSKVPTDLTKPPV